MNALKTSLLLAALIGGMVATAARAQNLPEVFPLGRSKASGAVCQAVRDYEDPLVQARGAKAWRVQCRGYSASLGRLYILPQAQAAAWRQATPARAACEAGASSSLAGVNGATRATCRTSDRQAAYVVYSGAEGRNTVAAEGYAPLSDVLETGLRVIAGAASPPGVIDMQVSAAQAEVGAGFAGGGLAAAEEAAASDPQRLRARGYVQNNEWRFDDAEAAFRALLDAAETGNAPPAERAEATMNLALNVSNRGRFDEADALFGEADALVAQANDPLLRARNLNYKALHQRNQGQFANAISLAEQALQARQDARAAGLVRDDAPAVEADGSVVRISASVAHGLNTRPGVRNLLDPNRVTLADELAIQDAQAQQIIGSSRAAGGDEAGARQALGAARAVLAQRETAGLISTRLRSRVEADLADIDLRAGRAAEAAGGYDRAATIMRTRHAGSAAEGALLLDLGAAQAAAGRQDEALATFDRAMAIFNQQRGGLGASADAAQPYFDLLLEMSRTRPAQAQAYAARFFEASQAAVSNATARTISRLAAQVASGDDETAGLARALQDAQRDVQIAESRIAMAQSRGDADEAAQVRAEANLKTLQAQADALEGELLAVNPRYNQLVSASAPVESIQKVLRPDEAYAKLLVLDGRSYGVLVTPQAVTPYAIDLPRDKVEAAVNTLRAPFEAQNSLPAFNVEASNVLFEMLFGPVKGELLAARHLIYEPDSALISLPVSTFVTDQASVDLIKSRKRPGAAPDYRNVAWLGTKMDSSLVVSGASFLQSRAFAPSKATRNYLGFGDPDLPRTQPRAYTSLTTMPGRRSAAMDAVCSPTRTALLDIPALPETGQEVRAVGASLGAPNNVVLGDAFNDGDIKSRTDLNQYRVLYFATHGLLPQPEGCLPEPALVTSLGGEGSDALLDMSEILNIKLDADLVVLAACDTGGAGATDATGTGLAGGGEALGGLARAMIYAGSRGLIVSHWSVDSASAVRVMTGLFASGAATQSEGLQKAQAVLQADASLSHPYYWAPFDVIGDGGRALPGA